ncbi:hypothetical protein SNEBB_011107 [Seison nebaliae]|nr:hypothetical protein SNEBB_011107 [Seison nebaliae]
MISILFPYLSFMLINNVVISVSDETVINNDIPLSVATTFKRITDIHQSKNDQTLNDMQYIGRMCTMKLISDTEETIMKLRTTGQIIQSKINNVDNSYVENYLNLVLQIHRQLDELQNAYAKVIGTTEKFLDSYLTSPNISNFRLQRRIEKVAEKFAEKIVTLHNKRDEQQSDYKRQTTIISEGVGIEEAEDNV